MLVLHRFILFACPTVIAFVLSLPGVLVAQSSPDTTSGGAFIPGPVAAWASAGVGPGKVGEQRSDPIAGVARATVSVGPWVLAYRSTDVGPFFGTGDGVRESSLLAGMRTGGHRLFATAEAGFSGATWYHSGGIDSGGYRTSAPREVALAYDVSLHANAIVPGIALSVFGDLGPGKSSYSAFTLSVELGWFGQ